MCFSPISRNILGSRIDFYPRELVLAKVRSHLDALHAPQTVSAEKRILSTTNTEFLLNAYQYPEFKSLLARCFLSVPDSVGVLLAEAFLRFLSQNGFDLRGICSKGSFTVSSLLHFIYLSFLFPLALVSHKVRLRDRISGADLIYDFCALSNSRPLTVFFLGGWPTSFFGRPTSSPKFDLATRVSAILQKQYPNIHVVGSTSRFGPAETDDLPTRDFIVQQMTRSGVSTIDILFVCYGNPSQEYWLQRNLPYLPVRLGIGLGGTFEYVAGIKPRAPQLIRSLHVEWFFRLLTQPWRWRRIFNATFVFCLRFIRNICLSA